MEVQADWPGSRVARSVDLSHGALLTGFTCAVPSLSKGLEPAMGSRA